MRLLVSAFAALAVLGSAPLALAQAAPPTPAEAAAQQKAFEDAVLAARASLPLFWQHLAESPGAPDDYTLKVAFKTPQGEVTDVWLTDIKRDGARITGRLNYNPDDLPNLHRNQIVPVLEPNIIDWSFKWGRKRYGEFTTRVIAKVHPEETAKTMATLSDNPLPADSRPQ